MDNPRLSQNDWVVDDKSDVELDPGILDLKSPSPQDLCAPPNVPRLIQLTWTSQKNTAKGIIIVSKMEMRRNKRYKKK